MLGEPNTNLHDLVPAPAHTAVAALGEVPLLYTQLTVLLLGDVVDAVISIEEPVAREDLAHEARVGDNNDGLLGAGVQIPQAGLRAREQVQAYFDGEITAFDLPLAPFGSPYRRRVWAALCTIPYGQTRTYQEIAAAAGGSARSVGGANGANPLPVLIPCHRVVGSSGLGGYSGGDGLDTKRHLLSLEARGASRTF